jgi:hypothetical protein
MSLDTLVRLIFFLIALLVVLYCIFPRYAFDAGPVLTLGTLLRVVVGLVILFVIYLLLTGLFLGALPAGAPAR